MQLTMRLNLEKMALGGALHLKEAEEALGAFTSSNYYRSLQLNGRLIASF